MKLPDRQALDESPDSLIVVDTAGTIASVNRRAEDLFGYTSDDLLGQPFELLIPAYDSAAPVDALRQFFCQPGQGNSSKGLNLLGRHKTGYEFPIDLSPGPVNGGTSTYTVVAIRDLPERRRGREHRFRAIFEQSYLLIGIIGADGTVLDANKKSLSFSGLHREDVIGKPFWDTGWWAHSPALQQSLRDAIKQATLGESVRFEATHPTFDDELATVDFSIRPVFDRDGKFLFLVAESHDVSEQKANEALIAQNHAHLQVLQQANAHAEEAAASKSRFLAAASHDLRQPLQSAGLYLSVISEQLKRDGAIERDALAELCTKMRQSLAVMGELLESLLDISKLDSGAIHPEQRDFHLKEVLDRIFTDNIQQAEEKGLRLRLYGDDCIVHSDPILLERVLENFVTNAIRYTERGEVAIECQTQAGTAHITVRDTGIGIPADQFDKIFEDYYQLDNPVREQHKGLGLGLSIVRHIAELLEHPISVQSEPGDGSSFTVSVPLGRAETQNELASDVTHKVTARRLPVVLFVDDDPRIADAVAMLLESAGMQVHTAQDGEAALAHLAAGVRPDLIVSDYRLPGYDGIEVIRRVRQQMAVELPGIIMTGDTAAREIASANLQQCTVVHKPVDPERLLSMIESLAA